MPEQLGIFEAAVRCRQAFKAATAEPRLMVSEWAENRMADFNLWCAGAGAFSHEKSSLEYRLRASPNILMTIINLLLMLKILVEDCIQAQPNKPVSETMNDVEDNLHQLTRLVHAIRKAGAWSRLQKADSFFDPDSSELRALSQHLQVVLCAQAEERGTSQSASKRLDPAQLQLTPIQARLVKGNLRRRNRFLYAQRHAMKLENITEAPRAVPNLLSPGPVRPLHLHRTETAGTPADPERYHTTQSATTATNVDEAILLPQRQTRSPTTVLSATSSKVDYPKPPPIQDQQTVFTCPCCCQALSTPLSKGSQWKKHLMEDIQPYTCILDNCPRPETFYMTRESWLEHMSSDHESAPQWTCRACSQRNVYHTFYESGHLKAHLESHHSKVVKSHLIPTLLSAWQQKMPLQVSSCPLCSFAAEERTDMLGHIAEHVHAFSLRSLPWAPSKQPDGHGERDTHGAYFKHHPYFEIRSSRSELSSDSSGRLASDKDADDLPALAFNTSQRLIHGSEQLELTEDLLKEVPDDLSGARANNWLANLDLDRAGIPKTPSRTPSETLVDASDSSEYHSKEGDDHLEDGESRDDEIAESRTTADDAELPRHVLASFDRVMNNRETLMSAEHMKRRIARRTAGHFRDVSRRTPVYENYAEFFYPDELRAEAQRQSPPMPTAVETEPVLPANAKVDEATGVISWPVPELAKPGIEGMTTKPTSKSISWGVPQVKVFEPDPDSETEDDSKAGATQAVKTEPDIEAMSGESTLTSESAGRRKPRVYHDYASFFYSKELRSEAQPQSEFTSMPTRIETERTAFTQVAERTIPDNSALPWPVSELKVSEPDSGLALETEPTTRALSPEAQRAQRGT